MKSTPLGPFALILPPLLLLLVLTTSCVGVIDGEISPQGCDENCDQSSKFKGTDDDWQEQFKGLVDAEVTRLSTYASTDDSWGACVTTWTIGGAALGEAASKTCVVVGVAAFETGVGAIAAAACVGADVVQADALLGAAAGYVSGYLACSAAATFPVFMAGFQVFNIGSESDETSDLEDWNTPECAVRYDEYKAVCGQPSSCRAQLMICEEFIERHALNIRCAELRNRHMYDCPHPDDYNWDTHQDEVGTAYQAAQVCQSQLCDTNCADLIDASYQAAFDAICL